MIEVEKKGKKDITTCILGQFKFKFIKREVVRDATNLCFMTMGDTTISSEYQVSAITYEDILHTYDDLHATYKGMKKHSLFKKEFASFEKVHSIILFKLNELKML